MTIITARSRAASCATLLIAGASLAACSPKNRDAMPDSARPAMAPTADSVDNTRARHPLSDSATGARATTDPGTTMPPTALSDTALLSLIASVDRSEADLGRIAVKKAQSRDVKAYAQNMVSAHTTDYSTVSKLATRINVPVAIDTMRGADANGSAIRQSPVMQQLQQSNAQLTEQLNSSTGAAFDRVYIDGMVAGHEQVLQLLRQNEHVGESTELSTHVQAVIKDVETHRDRAKAIQARLGAAAGSQPTR